MISTTTTSLKGRTVSFRIRAKDNHDGKVGVRCAPRSGSFFRLGRTRVTCRAHDHNGNVAVLFQINEFVIIGGAALGAMLADTAKNQIFTLDGGGGNDLGRILQFRHLERQAQNFAARGLRA